MDELAELMDLLEQNPTVEFSTLVTDGEENFKVSSSTCLCSTMKSWHYVHTHDMYMYVCFCLSGLGSPFFILILFS